MPADGYLIERGYERIAETYNEDDGVEAIYARQTIMDDWEYVGVRFRFGAALEMWRVRGGEELTSDAP